MLFVCTGNICRSPAAELLLRAGLGDGSGIDTASAGIAALSGEPVAPPMARLLLNRGIDPAGFTARQLDPAVTRSAALVLTMTTEQRSVVVARAPAAVRRTFTLREFVGLLGLADTRMTTGGPEDRLSALVRSVTRSRGLLAAAPEDYDIEDPYRRPDDVYARVLTQLELNVAAVVAAVKADHSP